MDEQAPAPRPRRRRGRRLLVVVLLVAGAVVLRRRGRRGAEDTWHTSGQPEVEPTVAAVPGRTTVAQPLPSPRLRAAEPLPGRPRLLPVLEQSLPHDTVDADELDGLVLPAGRTVIGRAPDADLRLEDPSVSPHHALLEAAPDGTVHVRDLGALNGLSVDGVPVVRAVLHDGNRIGLGESSLVFRTEPGEDDGGRQGGELGEQPHHREQGRD